MNKKEEKWEKERIGIVNWHRAKGVKYHRGETNAGLAERDYEVSCKHGSQPIIIIEGYHIWWCVSHHQPLAWCEKARVELVFDGITKLLVRTEHLLSTRSVTNKPSISIIKVK